MIKYKQSPRGMLRMDNEILCLKTLKVREFLMYGYVSCVVFHFLCFEVILITVYTITRTAFGSSVMVISEITVVREKLHE